MVHLLADTTSLLEAIHTTYLKLLCIICLRRHWCQSYHFLWANCLIKSGRECSSLTFWIHLALMRIRSMLKFKFMMMEGFRRLAKNASVSFASSLLLACQIMKFKEWGISVLKAYSYLASHYIGIDILY